MKLHPLIVFACIVVVAVFLYSISGFKKSIATAIAGNADNVIPEPPPTPNNFPYSSGKDLFSASAVGQIVKS